MKKNLSIIIISLLFSVTAGAQGVSKLFGLVGGYPQANQSSNGFLFNTDSSGNNFQLRYSFPVAISGSYPQNLEMAPYNGKLYGTTYLGGTNNFGTIFEYDPATNTYTKKFEFGPNVNATGGSPRGSLLLYNSKFYGLAAEYGTGGAGCIYEWDPANPSTIVKKYDLTGADGSGPQNSLRLMNGKMYGTTSGGGNSGIGTMFEWNPTTNVYTKLLDLNGSGAGSNGWSFYNNVTPYNNKLYCATQRGGVNDYGTLLMVDPTLPYGSNTTIVKNFDPASGGTANNNEMIVYNNKLYGCLYNSGTNSGGTLFELNPVGNIFTTLVNFNNPTTGSQPLGKLVANGSKFLGFCSSGGVNNTGTIYEWDPATPTTVVKKYDFGVNNNDNPINPGSTLALFNTKFYAVTYNGGFANQGTLFEYDYAAGTVTKKLNFNAAENGRIPYGKPVLLNGKIYGTCLYGPQENGTSSSNIWSFDPSTSIYSRSFIFDGVGNSANGYAPTASPVAYNNKLYGTTANGGISYQGVFYEFDPATNAYVKKDMQPIGGAYPIGEPTLYNNKFYGMTNAGGTGNYGIIYSYDPATGVLAKLYDVQNSGSNAPSGGFIVYNNKLYGSTSGGGANNGGGVIVYDPVANTASTVFSYSSAVGLSIQNAFAAYNNKFYVNAYSGGAFARGSIISFDPATNIATSVYGYTTAAGSNGYDPTGGLTVSGNKLFGITHYYGDNYVIQFDPSDNTVTTKSVYTPSSNLNLPVTHNGVTVVPAFIANGTPGSCESYPTVVINSSNNNQWVPILNSAGDVVAEIKANGNNLGTVTASSYINNGAVREESQHQLYLDRNLTITVQNQPSTNVDIRLYIKTSEFLALKNATNSLGQPSGVSTINDIAILKNTENCPSTLGVTPIKLTTVGTAYEYGYVLAASISSFSTFFFAKNTFAILPVTLIGFDAVKQDKIVKLTWRTENEINFSSFRVERSDDAINFKEINTVTARGGTVQNYYTINDNQPLAGLNYYRLKSIDKNGQFTYSNIVKIDFSKQYTISILPNPAKEYITINGADGFKQIQIIDVAGRVVKQLNKDVSNRYSVAGLNKGVYVVRLVGASETATSKIVIE